MATVSSSSNNRVTTQTQLNTILSAFQKADNSWFSLHLNNLGGTYHPIDDTVHIGWWGNILSGTAGALSPTETLTITETAPRTYHELHVVTDDAYDAHITSAKFTLYSGATVKYQQTHSIASFNWSVPLPTAIDADKLTIEILSISAANRVARIQSIFDYHLFTRADTSSLVLADTIIDTHVIEMKSLVDPINLTLQDNDKIVASLSSSMLFSGTLNDAIAIRAQLNGTDSLNTTGTEQSYITVNANWQELVSLTATDALTVKALLVAMDSLSLSLEEVSSMHNIHTVMTDPNRQVFGKVEITYTDPLIDSQINIVASSENRVSNINQLLDNVKVAQGHYFILNHNDLTGYYNPVDDTAEVGWLGNIISNADGSLPVAESITLSFSPRMIYELKLICDTYNNLYATDFTFTLYDAEGGVLFVDVTTGNTLPNWSKSIDYVAGCAKMQISITKLNKADSLIHVLELYTSVVETYYNNDRLVSLSLLEEYGPDSSALGDNNCLGTISSNELDTTLNNTDKVFNALNTSSKLYGLIKRNRRIHAWLGAVVNDVIEWHSLGVFYSTQWSNTSDALTATVTAQDSLTLCSGADLIGAYLYVNKSLYWLFNMLLAEVLTAEQYNVDISLDDIILPYTWFEKGTVSNALLRLVSCWIVTVYCDRQGIVQVRRVASTPYPMITISEDTNIIEQSENLAYTRLPNYVEVIATSYALGNDESVGEISNLTVPAGVTVLTISFTSAPCTDVILSGVTADAGITVVLTSYVSYEAVIIITAVNAGSVTTANLTGKILKPAVNYTATARDELGILQDGALKKTIAPALLQDYSLAQQAAAYVLSSYDNAKKDLNVDGLGDIAVTLGDKIAYDTSEFLLYRQTLDWAGGLDVNMDLKYLK